MSHIHNHGNNRIRHSRPKSRCVSWVKSGNVWLSAFIPSTPNLLFPVLTHTHTLNATSHTHTHKIIKATTLKCNLTTQVQLCELSQMRQTLTQCLHTFYIDAVPCIHTHMLTRLTVWQWNDTFFWLMFVWVGFDWIGSVVQSEGKLQQRLVKVWMLVPPMFCIFVCVGIDAFHVKQTNKQGGGLLDDSVKKWWPKVVAAVAQTDQATLDLQGVCAVWFSLSLWYIFVSFSIVRSGCSIEVNCFKWLRVALSALKHVKQLNIKGDHTKLCLWMLL